LLEGAGASSPSSPYQIDINDPIGARVCIDQSISHQFLTRKCSSYHHVGLSFLQLHGPFLVARLITIFPIPNRNKRANRNRGTGLDTPLALLGARSRGVVSIFTVPDGNERSDRDRSTGLDISLVLLSSNVITILAIPNRDE